MRTLSLIDMNLYTPLSCMYRSLQVAEAERAAAAQQPQPPNLMLMNDGLTYDSIPAQSYDHNILQMNRLEPESHHQYSQMDQTSLLRLV